MHIAQWGTYITTPVAEPASANVEVRTSIENKLKFAKNLVLRSVVINGVGKEVVIQSTEKAGDIRITAVSQGLKDAVIQVVSQKAGNN